MSRQEAIELLQRETDPGVFLVRNSNTIQGDLVLCVRLVKTSSNQISASLILIRHRSLLERPLSLSITEAVRNAIPNNERPGD